MDEETIIENFDWNHLSLERLKLLRSRINKAIDIKRRDLYLTKYTANIPQIYGYKASMANVFPGRLRSSISEYQNCVFGISLGSNNFADNKRLEACIKWISENFQTCLVLVCDSIYRLTIEVRDGLKGDEARYQAICTGEKFINENLFLFEKYSGSCRFEFKKTSQIEKQLEFEIYYEEIQYLYQQNQSFQKSVNSFVQAYLNRVKQIKDQDKQKKESLQEKKYLSTNYFFEESALNACLVKAGWLVFVYPGSIKTFEEISEGLHPEVPEPLKQMIWVSLRLKRNAKAGNAKVGEESKKNHDLENKPEGMNF
ncbi:MAG: tRNA-dependent cyclodipeptide synthase [Symploca sp. SIO3C6]|nr:tRNA-dependent cyclodipeptide synthase [Symploca sp. SIO3C6]